MLQINGSDARYAIDEGDLTDEQWRQHQCWKWYEEPPTSRCAVFLEIWKRLQPLVHEEIERQMTCIREWVGIENCKNDFRLPMSAFQLRELLQNRLFTIEMHTHRHPKLAGKEKIFQLNEILRSKKELITRYGIESKCLAYPYGSYDAETVKAIKDLGIEACFTTCADPITVDSNLAMLGRYQVFNGNLTDFKSQLSIKS